MSLDPMDEVVSTSSIFAASSKADEDKQDDSSTSTTNLRRNPKRSKRPTKFKSEDSDQEDEQDEKQQYKEVKEVQNLKRKRRGKAKKTKKDEEDEEEYEEVKEQENLKRKRRGMATKTKEEVQAEVDALNELRSWTLDYREYSCNDPDKEFHFYSTMPDQGSSPHPKFTAIQLVDMMKGQLCDQCKKSLASYFDRSGRKSCFACEQEHYLRWGQHSFEALAPSQASHLLRVQSKDLYYKFRKVRSVKSVSTGMWIGTDLYDFRDCCNAAIEIHGGFFSMHLAIAKYRNGRFGHNWPAKPNRYRW